MRISVVVPVHDNAAGLAECLRALVATAGPAAEIIVVDDGSTDGSAAVAERAGVGCVRLDRNLGAGCARNRGARLATGDVILFVDSDVVVAPDTLGRVARVLEDRPDVDAVFGSYDATPRAPGLVSQFRNLLHHFVHQHGEPEASTFWAGCGAIRRAAFVAAGGFDEGPYTRAIEDIELGYRLRAAGRRILLDRGLCVTHLKRWTLSSMMRTDVLHRAVPWSRLLQARETRLDHLNLTLAHRASVALVLVAAPTLLLAPLVPALLFLALAALAAFVAVNHGFFGFLLRARGAAFAAASVPLLFLHYLGGGLAYLWVWSGHMLSRAAGLRSSAGSAT